MFKPKAPVNLRNLDLSETFDADLPDRQELEAERIADGAVEIIQPDAHLRREVAKIRRGLEREQKKEERREASEQARNTRLAKRQAKTKAKTGETRQKQQKNVGAGNGKLAGKIALGVIAVVILSVLAAYLAGVFVLLSLKMSPSGVTLTTWYQYHLHFGDVPEYAKKIRMSLVFAGILVYGLPLLAVIFGQRQKEELHGSARFATDAEINKSGLKGNEGILVGKHRGRYLMFSGPRFVTLAAPTRSGKGVGCVIPNLLNWPESVVVQDIKLENWELTAGFRAQNGQACYLFNPFAENKRTVRYNPLDYVRDGEFRVGDLISIGESFFPSGGKDADAFFNDQARNLFVGLALFLCETPELPRTIGELLRQSSGKGQVLKHYLEGLINARNWICDEEGGRIQRRDWKKGDPGLPPLSEDCEDSLNRFLSITGNTPSNILASFNAPLGIWQNPIVDAATSASDFDLRDVRRRRMSIYIGITPDHLVEAGRLLNLFWSQLINQNIKELPEQNPDLKYTCLMVMDEFTAPGRIGILAKSVSYMAGYRLRLLSIYQSQSQLEGCYGREDARNLVTNHACQILYAPSEQRDANEYSEILGYKTVKAKSLSRSLGGRSTGGRNESESEQRRALMLPQEIKELGQWTEIVILENSKPIKCEKIRYFDDPVFTARLVPAPEIPLLDMAMYSAVRENRLREATVNDIRPDGTLDLSKIAFDASAVEFPDTHETISKEAAEALWEMAFAGISGAGGSHDSGDTDDDASETMTPEALAKLETQTIQEDVPESWKVEILRNGVVDGEDFDTFIQSAGGGDAGDEADYALSDDTPDFDLSEMETTSETNQVDNVDAKT
jgi:type IV secretion system protein VirD4